MTTSRSGPKCLIIGVVFVLVCSFCVSMFWRQAVQAIAVERCHGAVPTHTFGYEEGVDPVGGSVYAGTPGDDIIFIRNGPVTVLAGPGDDLICVTDDLPTAAGDAIIVVGGVGVDIVVGAASPMEWCQVEVHDCDNDGLPEGGGPPNVVFIMADDLGLGDLRMYYPDSPIATPNLDALAAGGMRFDHFRAAAPVCTPTRAALLTGRDPAALGIRTIISASGSSSTELPTSEETLAEMFNEAGYDTYHIGKWHLNVAATGPVSAGFQISVQSAGFYDTSQLVIDRGYPVVNGQKNTRSRPAVEDHADGSHTTELFTEKAIELISQRAPTGPPFYLNLWYDAPHINDNGTWTLPRSSPRFGDPGLTQAELYIELVQVLDTQIGRLMEALEAQGLADNTLVIFTSDNGGLRPQPEDFLPWSNADLRGHKNTHWEGGLRVPFIARWPAHIAASSTSSDPAVTEDIFPTFAALVGHDATRSDGASLLPSFAGEPNPAVTRRIVEFEGADMAPTIDIDEQNPYDWAVIEDGRWKLVSVAFGKVQLEFFDLFNDPSESTNLINDPAHSRHAAELLAHYTGWSESVSRAALIVDNAALPIDWSGSFDGSTSLVIDSNATIDFGSTDFTLSMNVLPERAALTSPEGVLVAERTGSFEVRIRPDGRAEVSVHNTAGGTVVLTSATALAPDIPTRLSFTVKDWVQGPAEQQAPVGRLYLDGVRQDMAPLAEAGAWVVRSSEPLVIGDSASSDGFVGKISNIEVHNRTLTATQLMGLAGFDSRQSPMPGSNRPAAANHRQPAP